MANLRLQSADLMAISRAMDTNGNNRIDNNEANISGSAQRQIGNSNGVVGTREFANALESGDIFLSGLNPATADKVAEYFSKREDNFDRPVAQWVSDAWISKADFEFNPEAKHAMDTNGDNKISRKELAQALTSGTVTIGQQRQVQNDPFKQPAQNDPFQNRDPFKQPAQRDPFQNRDPFEKPAQRDPFQNNDPFNSRPSIPDSGAYLQIEMVKTMSSDYTKGNTLMELAGKSNLSPREQEMLASAAVDHISSDYTTSQILTKLATNSNLHELGAVKIAKVAREISSDYTKQQLIDTLVNNNKLGHQATQSAIITIGTLSSDYSMSQSFQNLLSRQTLHPENQQLLLQTVQREISSDYTKQQIMDAMF